MICHLEVFADQAQKLKLALMGPTLPSRAGAAHCECSGRNVKEVLTQRSRIPFRKSRVSTATNETVL